jgi:D-glycero-alpha-D-manno-heptose-7-phosphate kinase
VGLLNALYAYRGEVKNAATLAREAAAIEIDVLGKPIGKQDQYAVAFGDLRKIVFHADGSVDIKTLELAPHIKRSLNDNLILFYTGYGREASEILAEQRTRTEENREKLTNMVALVEEMESCLRAGDLDEFGRCLHRGWELKKRLASKISNGTIDAMYKKALTAGALGGKITGAGGGGFLLLYCAHEKQSEVRRALSPLRELPFRFESDGSKIIFNVRR